jgi:hypothetical protein
MDHLTLVYEDEFLKLFWDTRARYHIADWTGRASGQKLRSAAYACVNASRANPGKGWLADVTRAEMIAPADQTWLVEDFYPRLARNGVRNVAFVVAASALAQIPVKRMNASYGEKDAIEFAYHPSRSAAASWLAAQLG